MIVFKTNNSRGTTVRMSSMMWFMLSNFFSSSDLLFNNLSLRDVQNLHSGDSWGSGYSIDLKGRLGGRPSFFTHMRKSMDFLSTWVLGPGIFCDIISKKHVFYKNHFRVVLDILLFNVLNSGRMPHQIWPSEGGWKLKLCRAIRYSLRHSLLYAPSCFISH